MIGTILLVFAFVFFCVAAAGVNLPRVGLGWAGLACWVLSILLGGAKVKTILAMFIGMAVAIGLFFWLRALSNRHGGPYG